MNAPLPLLSHENYLAAQLRRYRRELLAWRVIAVAATIVAALAWWAR